MNRAGLGGRIINLQKTGHDTGPGQKSILMALTVTDFHDLLIKRRQGFSGLVSIDDIGQYGRRLTFDVDGIGNRVHGAAAQKTESGQRLVLVVIDNGGQDLVESTVSAADGDDIDVIVAEFPGGPGQGLLVVGSNEDTVVTENRF